MAKVHVVNVVVLDNPSPFTNDFQFEITFECIEDLAEDLEWKVIYVGSAESEEYDQVLDSVFVGPVPEGRHMFVFQAAPPDPTKIPVQDAVGVTVVLLTCSYRGREFIRVGYYVNNSYTDAELVENPPATPQYDKLQRNILATNPRVTRFMIDWDEPANPDQGGDGNEHSQTNGSGNDHYSKSVYPSGEPPSHGNNNSYGAHDSCDASDPSSHGNDSNALNGHNVRSNEASQPAVEV